VGIPPSYLPLPTRGTLFGIKGYSRQVNDQAWKWEWILQGDADPVDSFVDGLSPAGHWKNLQARDVVKTMIQRLFSAGIPRETIATQIPQFINAIVTEYVAEQTP
jgi:hypothetical protein